MNRYDVEYERVKRTMDKGGKVSTAFEIATPTGAKSKLTYVEQLIVRTTAFKNWFGDWEQAAKIYILTEKNEVDKFLEEVKVAYNQNYPENGDKVFENSYNFNDLLSFKKSYEGVSKCIDGDTLEPSVVYHGTRADEKFYEFKTKITGSSRPYAYFAVNKEYSKEFSKTILYKCFISVKKPFMVNNFARKTIVKWIEDFITRIFPLNDIDSKDNAQVFDFITWSVGVGFEKDEEFPFWYFMARDREGYFKKMLESFGFDSILYGEELYAKFDFSEKGQFTRAYTIFNSNQVKLAWGLNTQFNPMINDIRYEEGGSVEKNIMLPDTSAKFSHLKKVLNMQGYQLEPINTKINETIISEDKYEVGGTVKHKKGETNDAKKGGYFEGRSHADGGIKAWNISTDSPIEVEGGEVIITKKAVEDDELYEFEGEMLTNRQILSKINQSGGGVAFEDGGEIHQCNCSGKMFKFGGETMEDYMVIKKLGSSYESKNQKRTKMAKYGHRLMSKMKQGGFI